MEVRKISTEKEKSDFVKWFTEQKLTRTLMVTVKNFRAKRSISQNALYWFWLTIIANRTGNSKDVIHEVMREKYLELKKVVIYGETTFVRESTKDLDTKRYTIFLDNVKLEANENLIYLPLPGDRGYDELYEKYKGV